MSCCQVTSVVSDSVRPHRWQPTRLCHPWDSPGKSTGVGCHSSWNVYYHLKMIRTSLAVHAFTEGSGSILAGKESTCNAGDTGSWVGKIHWRGISYLLQYSWAFLVAQLVKNLPVVQETWVQSLGWKDPLEKGTATHSSIPAWRIPWTV